MGNPELTAQVRNPGGPWDLRLASEVGSLVGLALTHGVCAHSGQSGSGWRC